MFGPIAEKVFLKSERSLVRADENYDENWMCLTLENQLVRLIWNGHPTYSHENVFFSFVVSVEFPLSCSVAGGAVLPFNSVDILKLLRDISRSVGSK